MGPSASLPRIVLLIRSGAQKILSSCPGFMVRWILPSSLLMCCSIRLPRSERPSLKLTPRVIIMLVSSRRINRSSDFVRGSSMSPNM